MSKEKVNGTYIKIYETEDGGATNMLNGSLKDIAGLVAIHMLLDEDMEKVLLEALAIYEQFKNIEPWKSKNRNESPS